MRAGGLPGHMGSHGRARFSLQGGGWCSTAQMFSYSLEWGLQQVRRAGYCQEGAGGGKSLGSPQTPCWHYPWHVRGILNMVEWMSKPGPSQCQASAILARITSCPVCPVTCLSLPSTLSSGRAETNISSPRCCTLWVLTFLPIT